VALFGLAAFLLFSGPYQELGAVPRKCGLLTSDPVQARSCSSLDPWSSFAPPLLRGVQATFSVDATFSVAAYRSVDDHTALSLFEQARATHPSDPLVAYWLANTAYRSGDQAEAILSCKALGPRKMALFFRNRSKDALESGDALRSNGEDRGRGGSNLQKHSATGETFAR
jgi:hypothetical protein